MISLLNLAMILAVGGVMFRCPIKRRGRGRRISRPFGRIVRLGKAGVMGAQSFLIWAMVGWEWSFGDDLVTLSMLVIAFVWILDDHLTGDSDDDGKRRRRYGAKAKLRMPKPVKLRPAERWAPVPA